MGAVGGLGAKPGPEADPGVAGGGGDGVSGKGEVGAQIRLGLRYRLSERIRQSPEAYAEFGNDTAEAAASPRYRGAVREPAACRCSVNRTRKIAELIPELYLHGLSEGDFDLALRGLLGEDAPVSASTVARLKSKWNDELAQWRSRPLDDLEVVYMWVDGVYVKAGLEKEKAAVLVVMAALSDGSKVVVSTVPGYRESTESWSEVLRDIKRRGLSCPRLVVGDGHLGIWGALRNVYPQAAEQRCWNHKIVNVLAKLPKRQQDQAKLMLRTIPYAPTRTEAERLRTVFTRWCGDHSYEAASEALERDWDRMVTFYDFPKEHWGHLRTTNPVESPFAALRLRTDAAKRYKRVDRAIAVIWKMLMVAEGRFRRLKAPELIEDVYLGAQYADGIAIESTAEMVAA